MTRCCLATVPPHVPDSCSATYIDDDPQFADADGPDNVPNTADDDFRLASGSPCVDTSQGADLGIPPLDSFDVDQDRCTSETTPSLDSNRLIDLVPGGNVIDIGCYERQPVPPACPADINSDNAVNVLDLLAVINGWGLCPTICSSCPADIVHTFPDNTVNVEDLLLVINSWGCCPCCQNCAGGGESFAPVGDCMDAASEEYEAFTAEWFDLVNDCLNKISQAGY